MTLTASDYNGYNISCFGVKDGAIDATVSGGTAPYTYAWSNNATTEDLSGLATGYYRLVVTDAASATEEAEITLTEPLALRVGVDPFTYPSGMNVSCNECFNGSIDITVADGVPPYSYQWEDGPTTADRSGLGALAYQVIATDANGCTIASGRISLTQPERDDWSKQGNAGTNPNQHYFGTSDAKDVVFKSNGQERFRLLAGGGAKLSGLGGGGILKGGGDGLITVLPDEDLQGYIQDVISNPTLWELEPFWKTNGNTLENQQQIEAFVGSVDDHPLRFRTNNIPRMNLTQNGDLGIIQRLGVGFDLIENTLGAGQCRVHINELQGGWLRFTKGDDYHWQFSRGLSANDVECLRVTYGPGTALGGETPLLLQADGGLRAGPSLVVHADGKVSIAETNLVVHADGKVSIAETSFVVHTDGKVSIGEVSTNTPNYGYKLYVEGGILTEKVRVALKNTSQWSDHVFAPGYRLLGMDDLKGYIQENGHLPGVPSAECMVEEGLDVLSMNALLLEKIEELTLHLLDVNDRLRLLEAERAGNLSIGKQ